VKRTNKQQAKTSCLATAGTGCFPVPEQFYQIAEN